MWNWLEFIYILGVWTFFGIVHSILASRSIKQTTQMDNRSYRIIFNILSTILFIGILVVVPSPIPVLYRYPMIRLWQQLISGLFALVGLIILGWGLLEWDLTGFLGFTKEDEKLTTKGAYSFSRHPVYSGIILILIGLLFIELSLTIVSWVVGAGGYFLIGSIPEEKKLLNRFGDEYRQYRSQTARLFPHTPMHFKQLFGD